MPWDKNDKGQVVAAPLMEFEVIGYTEDQKIVMRLKGDEVQIQFVMDPEYAGELGRDLTAASARVADAKRTH